MRYSIRAFIIVVSFFGSIYYSISTIAGGYSDGGGDTSTEPTVTGERIAESIKQAGPAILAWLYQQQSYFLSLPLTQQKESPLAKLFPRIGMNIFDHLKKSKYDLMLKEPCFDSTGNPKEGSTANLKPHHICLSPYLMAPKLKESNVDRETAGLIIHELSHLLGTSEVEALNLQTMALIDFSQMPFTTINATFEYLVNDKDHGKIDEVLLPLNFWMLDPEQNLTFKDCFAFMNELVRLKELLTNQPIAKFQFLSYRLLSQYQAQFVRLAIIQMFVNANDKKTPEYEQRAAQDLLNKLFPQDQDQTAAEVFRKLGGKPTPDYENLILHKPQSWDDIVTELKRLRSYLNEIKADIVATRTFVFETSSIN